MSLTNTHKSAKRKCLHDNKLYIILIAINITQYIQTHCLCQRKLQLRSNDTFFINAQSLKITSYPFLYQNISIH